MAQERSPITISLLPNELADLVSGRSGQAKESARHKLKEASEKSIKERSN